MFHLTARLILSVWHWQILSSENHQRNADVELQQRSVEYVQLSRIATTDVLVFPTLPLCYFQFQFFSWPIFFRRTLQVRSGTLNMSQITFGNCGCKIFTGRMLFLSKHRAGIPVTCMPLPNIGWVCLHFCFYVSRMSQWGVDGFWFDESCRMGKFVYWDKTLTFGFRFELCLLCFDTVGWVTGMASGL